MNEILQKIKEGSSKSTLHYTVSELYTTLGKDIAFDRCEALFEEAQVNLGFRFRYAEQLMQYAVHFTDENGVTPHFMKLSKKLKLGVLKNCEYLEDETPLYVKLIFQSGSKKAIILNKKSDISILHRTLKRSLREGKLYYKSVRDLSKISKDFLNSLSYPSPISHERGLNDDASNSILMRAIYGEDLIIEITERLLEADSEASLEHINSLAKSWDEVKDYPIDWAIESAALNGA